MVATTLKGFSIDATDVTGQRSVRVSDVPSTSTVGDLIRGLVPRMELVQEIGGRPITYGARLEREGRHLNVAERVSDALQDRDQVVLLPNVSAG